MACGLSCQPLQADEDALSGSSNRKYRNDAIQAIPFAELKQETQAELRDVVENPSFYRRLPVATIDADPDYFRLLVRKPEILVSIWQLMGVTHMTCQRVGPYQVKTDDGAGTISDLELIYGNNDLHVYYGHGSYEGSFLRKQIQGRCVIVVRTQTAAGETSGFQLTSQVDVFLKVDNAAAALITRTIQPVVGSTADHNFVESLKFVQRLNQTTRDNGPGVKGMGQRLELDDSTRQAFFTVVDRVFDRAYRLGWHTGAAQTATLSDQSGGSVAPTQDVDGLSLYRPSSQRYQYFDATAETTGQPQPARRVTPTGYRRLPAVVDQPGAVSSSPSRAVRVPLGDQSMVQSRVPVVPASAVEPTGGSESQGFSVLEGGPRSRNTSPNWHTLGGN